jgi:hypothetical protein
MARSRAGGGFARVAQAEQELAEGAQGVGVFRREADDLAIALRGLGRAAERAQGVGERGVRVEAIGLQGDGAAEHGHGLFGAAEREVREARADEGGDGVDAVAEGQLVGLGRAARVAIGGEHVAEQEGGVDVPDLDREHFARGGRGLVTELARSVGAGDLEQQGRVVRGEASGLGEIVGACCRSRRWPRHRRRARGAARRCACVDRGRRRGRGVGAREHGEGVVAPADGVVGRPRARWASRSAGESAPGPRARACARARRRGRV